MAARRFNLRDSSFVSGYTTIGPFGQRSRADQIHHGRSGINRRRHQSLCLDIPRSAYVETFNGQESKNKVGGSSRQRRDNLATQTRTTSGNQERFREESNGFRGNSNGRGVHFSESNLTQIQRDFLDGQSEKQTSGNRGIHIDFVDEHDDRSRNTSRTTSRQQNERFSEDMNRNTRPQRGSSYNEVFSSTEAPFNSFRESTSQIGQQSAYQNGHQERDFTDGGQQQMSTRAFQPNILREEVVWQPVKVIYVEKTPSEIKQNGMGIREREYSSSAYGQESRAGATHLQQSSYDDDWGGRQWENGYVDRSHPPAYETTLNGNTNGNQRHNQVSVRRASPRKSREGSYQQSIEVSQPRDHHTESTWNGSYVNMSPPRNDSFDGISNSRSLSSSRLSQDREYGYPTQMVRTAHSKNGTLRNGGEVGLNSGYAGQGMDSFTYTSQSQNTPRLLQNTGLNGSAFGARSQGRQVPIAHDNSQSQSSRLNFSRSSGLELNGGRSGGFREQFAPQKSTMEIEEKEFFGKITKELENQRQNLKPEVDKLIRNSSIVTSDSDLTNSMNGITLEAGKNSYIDTSLPTPIFKAYVDIKEFSPKSVKVNYDHATNKVVVEASQFNEQGTVGKTFTQRIALPKYADDLRLIARMNSGGVLRIEVPLLFYFPEEHEEDKARSFLYEARTNTTDGSKALEIIVKPGADYSLRDIQPEVVNNTLIIWGGKGKQKKSIGKYVLPPTVDVKNITHRSGKDGCLTIVVPVT